jgi:TRAP-type C4-dicarboxylate transport system substrate-binding protein
VLRQFFLIPEILRVVLEIEEDKKQLTLHIRRKSMKKHLFVSLIFSLVIGLVLSGFGSQPQSFAAAASPGQVIKITWAEQNNETGYGPKYSEIPYLKRMEEATGNRIKFEPYWSQTLVKGPDIWNAVKTGTVDAGWCFHNYWAGMTELANSISLPGLRFKDVEHASAVLYQIYQEFPSIRAEFKDVHVLTPWADGYQIVLTRAKQIKTLDDFKGLKIRTAGMNPTNLFRTLGATPVQFPMPDSYLSLDKGVIDGMTSPFEAAMSFRLYEVTKFMTVAPWGFFFFTYSMNKEKWDSLPKDIQDAITKVSNLENARMLSRHWEERAMQDLMQVTKGKVESYVLSDSEVQRLYDVSKPLREEWVKKMTAAGKPDAAKILQRIEELIPLTAR